MILTEHSLAAINWVNRVKIGLTEQFEAAVEWPSTRRREVWVHFSFCYLWAAQCVGVWWVRRGPLASELVGGPLGLDSNRLW